MAFTKSQRAEVYAKYDGHCAYCGVKLTEKAWQLDHIDSQYLGGKDEVANANPSCRRCNIWKATYTVEEFREQIAKRVSVLRRDSSAFKAMEDFGLIKETGKEVKFHFETINKPTSKPMKTDSYVNDISKLKCGLWVYNGGSHNIDRVRKDLWADWVKCKWVEDTGSHIHNMHQDERCVDRRYLTQNVETWVAPEKKPTT